MALLGNIKSKLFSKNANSSSSYLAKETTKTVVETAAVVEVADTLASQSASGGFGDLGGLDGLADAGEALPIVLAVGAAVIVPFAAYYGVKKGKEWYENKQEQSKRKEQHEKDLQKRKETGILEKVTDEDIKMMVKNPNEFWKDIKVIGPKAFEGRRELAGISIPNSVTKIDEKAFDGCSNLKTIYIGNGVTEIGNNAFAYCKNLSEIKFGNNLQKVGGCLFEQCNNLKHVEIPDSVKEMDKTCFNHSNYCTYYTSKIEHFGLEKVSLPAHFTKNDFEQNKELAYITFTTREKEQSISAVRDVPEFVEDTPDFVDKNQAERKKESQVER